MHQIEIDLRHQISALEDEVQKLKRELRECRYSLDVALNGESEDDED